MSDHRACLPPDSRSLDRPRTVFRLGLIAAASLTWLSLRPFWHAPAVKSFLETRGDHVAVWLVGDLACFLVLLAEHELGHLVAAVLVGFHPTYVRISGIVLVFEDEAWRFRLSPRVFSGRVQYTFSPQMPGLRWRLALVSAAGAAANVFTILPALILFFWAQAGGQPYPMWSGAAVWCMFCSALLAGFSIFPVRELGICSDGDRVLHYWFIEWTRVRAMELSRQLDEALIQAGETKDAMLANVGEGCERLLEKTPREAFVLHVYGVSLWHRGSLAELANSRLAADRLYAMAEEKFFAARNLTPDNPKLSCDLANTLFKRSALHPGEAGLVFLAKICEVCERWVASSPTDSLKLHIWGHALLGLGIRTSGLERDRLYTLAEAKLSAALALAPSDKKLIINLGNTLARRARLQDGEGAHRLLRSAREFALRALQEDPLYEHGLNGLAHILYDRTKRFPGAETNRLLADGVSRLENAAQTGADPDALLGSWGIIFWAQGRSTVGEESVRLLRRAKQKLLLAESREPRSNAYNLGRLCAELGELSECRHWLEQSGEPGILVSREEMAAEAEFESVLNEEWFRQDLFKLSGAMGRP
jgi:tetratricopeptide (TPR) repeat protein